MAYDLPDLPELPTLVSTTIPTPISLAEIDIPARMAAFTNTISADKIYGEVPRTVITVSKILGVILKGKP